MEVSTFAQILGLTVFIIINILAINNYAYDSAGKVQCNNYVLNTYLYVILGFVMMGLVFVLDDRFSIFRRFILNAGSPIVAIIVLGIVLLGLTFILTRFTPDDQIKAHMVWTLLMVLLGVMVGLTISAYAGAQNSGVVQTAILLTILITAATGFLGYKYGASWMSVDFEKWLNWSLIGLVILSLGGLFIKDAESADNFFYGLAIMGLIIFTLLLFAYNKNIRIRAESCTKPLYPQESFGLIIKIVNVLQNLMRILGRSRRR